MNYFKCKGESYKTNDYIIGETELQFTVEKSGTLEQLLAVIGGGDTYEFGLLDDEDVGLLFSTKHYIFVGAEETGGAFVISYKMSPHMMITREDRLQSEIDYVSIMTGTYMDEV